MKFSIYKKILEKYYTKKSSEAEKRLVDSWYASFEWDKTPIEHFETTAEKQMVSTRIWGNLQTGVLAPKPNRRLHHARLWAGIAASIVLIGCGVWSISYFSSNNSLSNGGNETTSIAQRSSTTVGERKKVVLPDGSIVILNARSTISILPGYGKNEREVILEGEAFFEIHGRPESPFRVKTNDIAVQVLGTSFNIKAYSHRQETQVAVQTGKVKLSNTGQKQQLILAANESGSYDRNDDRFTAHIGALGNAWLTGAVALDRADFEELAATFYDIYGVVLKSEDPTVLQNHYTINLKYHRSATDAVETICHILNKQYRKEVNGDLKIF
ncbi:FecR domain-containing protein [Olivibacter sp. SDN3]|uniref:FecR family protein n=1 Tax=Olivibacter sp. SDN3 TaxID=2764720 RepID=UPI001650F607|nr:FecR family protein [Olivibacter sp. SDN3]QNL51047.1 FecR domain-containing protein [Olivibacter sp. SDN3]